MRLASFDAGNGAELGAVCGDAIIPLKDTLPSPPADMIGLIAGWDALEPAVRAAVDREQGAITLTSVRLLAPFARPGKIMAIGLNYADHIVESGMEKPAHQTWFAKATTSASGPYDAIELPGTQPRVDYEGELVAVIGRGGRRIRAADAPAAVVGFCVGNDVTERAWQHRTPQWTLGKSFDTHAPFGPWITTADEVADPHALDIEALVNGERRQTSNTRNLVFDLWAQIEHLSEAMTLEPGDLIFTGTPGGVGAAMKPMRFLASGDVVRVEIERLGAIENRCEARP